MHAVFTALTPIAALLTFALLMASKTFGMRTAARMAITASTPIISISVKPLWEREPALLDLIDLTFILVALVAHFEGPLCAASAQIFSTSPPSQLFPTAA